MLCAVAVVTGVLLVYCDTSGKGAGHSNTTDLLSLFLCHSSSPSISLTTATCALHCRAGNLQNRTWFILYESNVTFTSIAHGHVMFCCQVIVTLYAMNFYWSGSEACVSTAVCGQLEMLHKKTAIICLFFICIFFDVTKRTKRFSSSLEICVALPFNVLKMLIGAIPAHQHACIVPMRGINCTRNQPTNSHKPWWCEKLETFWKSIKCAWVHDLISSPEVRKHLLIVYLESLLRLKLRTEKIQICHHHYIIIYFLLTVPTWERKNEALCPVVDLEKDSSSLASVSVRAQNCCRSDWLWWTKGTVTYFTNISAVHVISVVS